MALMPTPRDPEEVIFERKKADFNIRIASILGRFLGLNNTELNRSLLKVSISTTFYKEEPNYIWEILSNLDEDRIINILVRYKLPNTSLWEDISVRED